MFFKTLLLFLVVDVVWSKEANSNGQMMKDYSYIDAEKSFYKIHFSAQTWSDAKRLCAQEGATLWHPDNDNEAHAVVSFWNNTLPNIGVIYVGMSDIMAEGQFETVDGKLVSDVYNKWEPGQPNNYAGKQDCIRLYKSGIVLDDCDCGDRYNFICKKSLQSLQCKVSDSDGQMMNDYSYIDAEKSFYKIHFSTLTWSDAKQLCAQEGATLWHPDNDNEAHAVVSLWNKTLPNIGVIYVGMSDIMAEGQFETVDGKLVSDVYNKWEPGQPNNYAGKQDCIRLYKSGIVLDDCDCGDRYNFICKKSLQSLQCKVSYSDGQMMNDYSYIDAEKSFYKIHFSTLTWSDAKQLCAQEGATLWHPDNDNEAHAVVSFWNNTLPNIGVIYVGMSDIMAEGQFETVDGKLVSDVYNKWEPGQPNNYAGKQDCIRLYKSGIVLDDCDCGNMYNFICKKSLQSLQCKVSESDGQMMNDYSYIDAEKSFYKIHFSTLTWSDAKQLCAQEGATLWHPDNDNEAHAVVSLWNNTLPNIGVIYVGMSDIMAEGQFETVDGKLVSDVYNKWEPGQPNNYAGKQDCIRLYKSGIVLDDCDCGDRYNFICKKSLQSLQCKVSDSDGQMDVRPNKFFRNDYSYVESEKTFYKIHISEQTWVDAKRVCAQEGATFWHPDDDNEAHAVVSFWNNTLPNIGVIHVGMSDKMAKGQFETVEGKLVSDVYNKWEPGQPNNYGGQQDCIRLYKSGVVLDDCDCDIKYNFICKKSLQSLEWNNQCHFSNSDYTFNQDNGKCYKVHTTPLSWVDAYATCLREQSHLAVISNQLDLDHLVNLTESIPKPRVKENYQRGIYHVGFHNRFKEGWQTVKGTPMNVDAELWWDSYKPADDRDMCGSMFYTGRLINTDCDMKSFFVCEHEQA